MREFSIEKKDPTLEYHLLNQFAERSVPLLAATVNGAQMIQDALAMQATDRWNSFHLFHETVSSIVSRYDQTGLPTNVNELQTGGGVGSGHWIIHEASDVLGATLHAEHPIRRKILDYQDNPWHLTQWSAGTPQEGLAGAIAVVDSAEHLDSLAPESLSGRFLLTGMDPRPLLSRVASLGALGIITDQLVPNCPKAVAWSKFGWGGLPVPYAAARLIGLGLSANEGKRLRQMVRKYPQVIVRANVQVRLYIGHHEVVSAIVRGRETPEKEIWCIAHYAEPGALDNASGVAVSIGIARAITRLIRDGKLIEPRRSIRFVHGYEAYGTLGFLKQSGARPLASVNLDTVGAKPDICDGCLDWCATTPMTAGFVNVVGTKLLVRALNEINSGYRLRIRPFMGSADALMADPLWGCPCPSLHTYRRRDDRVYDAYHSSADTIDLLSPLGLEACATAIASYLLYLADADESHIVELAANETKMANARIKKNRSRTFAHYVCCQHETSMSALAGWLFDDKLRRKRWTRYFRPDVAVGCHGLGKRSRCVPVRRVPFVIMHENIPSHVWHQISQAGLPLTTLYWADGNRDVEQIRDLTCCDLGKHIALERVTRFFEALAELGYVRMRRL